ncbi:TPA: hypothetical protein PGG59_005243 [Raoultella planticola]|nr:hypothetical protein [Raoultella planticola]
MKKTVLALGLCVTSLGCLATDSTWKPYDAVVTINDDVVLTATFTAVTGLTSSSINSSTILGNLSLSLSGGVPTQMKVRFATEFSYSGTRTEGYMQGATNPSAKPGIELNGIGWEKFPVTHEYAYTLSSVQNATVQVEKLNNDKIDPDLYTTVLEAAYVI